MKQVAYKFFAAVYNGTQSVTKKTNKVVLFNGHNRGISGNLELVGAEIKKSNPACKLCIYSKADLLHPIQGGILKKISGIFNFFVKVPMEMATAKQIFLNDNFIPLAYMHTGEQQIVQLWHGAGAFKRFGLSTESDPQVRHLVREANQKVTHLFVTSKQVISYYEEAFGIARDKIYATGIPITDAYFDATDKEERRQHVLRQYPMLHGKKVLLYAPTFRPTEEENQQLMQRFHVTKLQKKLGEDWMILIKMHPKFPAENIPTNENCINMTAYSDITDLYMVADCLITDYSSTVVEYVLLDKPIYFFAYDLEQYDRGFYWDYRQTVPGNITDSVEELAELILRQEEVSQKRQTFVKLQYDYIQGGAVQRIFEVLNR